MEARDAEVELYGADAWVWAEGEGEGEGKERGPALGVWAIVLHASGISAAPLSLVRTARARSLALLSVEAECGKVLSSVSSLISMDSAPLLSRCMLAVVVLLFLVRCRVRVCVGVGVRCIWQPPLMSFYHLRLRRVVPHLTSASAPRAPHMLLLYSIAGRSAYPRHLHIDHLLYIGAVRTLACSDASSSPHHHLQAPSP